MKYIAIALNISAFFTGMTAALYWLKASRIDVQDPFLQDGISRNVESGDFVWPIIEAFKISANLNRVAALLTAATVFLGTLGNLASAIAS